MYITFYFNVNKLIKTRRENNPKRAYLLQLTIILSQEFFLLQKN
jgi:hypothetical protein